MRFYFSSNKGHQINNQCERLTFFSSPVFKKQVILVQYTIFFSGRKNKTKQNAAPLDVVYATSERFNKPSRRFIFAYLFILSLTGSGYVQISQRKQKSCCIPLLLKISPLFKVKVGDFKN